jgi:hypothetical protein
MKIDLLKKSSLKVLLLRELQLKGRLSQLKEPLLKLNLKQSLKNAMKRKTMSPLMMAKKSKRN